ncbi:MAG: CvpA family protein [Methanobacteriaceae archaeon]
MGSLGENTIEGMQKLVEEPKSNNLDNHKKSGKKDNERGAKKKSSQNPSLTRFRDFITGADVISNINESSDDDSPKGIESIKKDRNDQDSSDSSKKQVSRKTSNKNSEKTRDFHINQELIKFKFIRNLHSRKDKLLRIMGVVVGVIFIIAGVVYIYGSAIKVVDNVEFGDRAVTSAFLVLIGLLIIAAVFARQLWRGTFLKNMQNQLQVAEDKPTKSKDTQKDNIEEKDKK